MYRRKTVEKLLRDKDRTITYLSAQNDRLLDRVMVLAGQRAYEPPLVAPEPEPGPELADYSWHPEQELDAEPAEIG